MRERQNSATLELSFYKLFWTFFLFSVLGYIFEITVQFLYTGRFENHQGLIYGPFSQIYGIGAVFAVIICRKIYNRNIILVYALCVLGGGLFEYACSLAQEILFGSTSWNYGMMRFSINGRTNLTYSLVWGVFGVIIITYVYPKISDLLDRAPRKNLVVLTWVVFLLMLGNVTITAAVARRQYERHKNIPAENKVQVFLDKKYPDSYLENLSPRPNFK